VRPVNWECGLSKLLQGTYAKNDDGDYVTIDGEFVTSEVTVEITAVLRVMVLHGGPPESLTAELAPPLQRIVQDGARLRARLPGIPRSAMGTSELALLARLLPPLMAIVHGYEGPTTTDEIWATARGSVLFEEI
jgi:hypothetical protein